MRKFTVVQNGPRQDRKQAGNPATPFINEPGDILLTGEENFISITRLKKMINRQVNDPMHGITLEVMLTQLVQQRGWEELGKLIEIKCFIVEPSIASSLKFLRRTPWARKKVEDLYLSLTKTS